MLRGTVTAMLTFESAEARREFSRYLARTDRELLRQTRPLDGERGTNYLVVEGEIEIARAEKALQKFKRQGELFAAATRLGLTERPSS